MRVALRCGKCRATAMIDDPNDTCLEIDAVDMEIRFVCRFCKKENRIKLKRLAESEPLPGIGTTPY